MQEHFSAPPRTLNYCARVGVLDFRQRVLIHPPRSVGRSIECGIVDHDHLPVPALVDIHLQRIDDQLDGLQKRFERVLRGARGVTPVADNGTHVHVEERVCHRGESGVVNRKAGTVFVPALLPTLLPSSCYLKEY